MIGFIYRKTAINGGAGRLASVGRGQFVGAKNAIRLTSNQRPRTAHDCRPEIPRAQVRARSAERPTAKGSTACPLSHDLCNQGCPKFPWSHSVCQNNTRRRFFLHFFRARFLLTTHLYTFYTRFRTGPRCPGAFALRFAIDETQVGGDSTG
jgi:hypothetical protein